MTTRKRTASLPKRPSLPSVAPDESGGVMRILRGVVKALSLGIGGTLTLIALMATTGLVVESGWIRAIVAALVMLVVPAVIVDRMLPESVDAKAKGLPTDVFSLAWLSIALLYSVGLHDLTQPALLTEGDRLSEAGYPRLAKVAYFIAGVTPTPTATASPKPKQKSSTPGRASASTKAPPPPIPSATLAASASAAPSASAPQAPAAPPKQPAEKDAAALFEELAPAVVTVQVGDKEQIRGGGTGFLIDDKGTIATNHHVIESASQVRVTFKSGARYHKPVLLTEDAAVDLALLRVDLNKPDEGEPVEIEPAKLGDSDSIVVGQRAVSIGNPLGLDHTLTDGLISARRVYNGRKWIQTSVPISPGNSGGPLFNMKGEVIGVTTASLGGIFGRAQNLNLAVPVNILKSLLSDKYPGKREIGDGSRSTHW